MEQTNVRIVVYFDGATPYRESEVTRKDAVYVSRVPQIGEVLVLHDANQCRWEQVTLVGHLTGRSNALDPAAWVSVLAVEPYQVADRAQQLPGRTYPA
jgi:hypothetical protein